MEDKIPTAEEAYAFQYVVDDFKNKVQLCRSMRVYCFTINKPMPPPFMEGFIEELKAQIDSHWITTYLNRIQFTDKRKYAGPLRFETCSGVLLLARPITFELLAAEINEMRMRLKSSVPVEEMTRD